jgi:hypothetical protein
MCVPCTVSLRLSPTLHLFAATTTLFGELNLLDEPRIGMQATALVRVLAKVRFGDLSSAGILCFIAV